MSGLFNYDNPIMQFLSKAFDLMLLGILWLVCSLPVITLGAATAAMYTVLMKMVRNDGYYVLKTYFYAFKENFKQATLIWLILLAVIAVLAADLLFAWAMSGSWFWTAVLAFLLVLTVLVVCVVLYVFPLQACFVNTVKNTMKNALLFALSHPLKTLLMLIADAAVIALILFCAQPLTLFIGVLVALPNALILRKIFSKYLDEEKPAEAAEQGGTVQCP